MKIISHSVKDTLRIGRRIARHLKGGEIICLHGELGAGKTVLVKGIAEGLGIKADAVMSPTFILIRVHTSGKFPLYHADLYRLRHIQEVMDLGYEEYLYGKGITVIEWADRLGNLLPTQYFKIELMHRGNSQRALCFSACGHAYERILSDLKGKLMKNKR
ncbi:MAG: tRNA (adenosine(37)-N6)-threonylcarbamoyltransferase complex ATPase subunit type 1 TsaE [Candidatus Omnitrophica bacterium]|nr:tRNA (adenosine(37)-N6)-threonylcarbamoyltransferase complex ATPase subunit type 1 TsaE [Candidatus Omnitrophota bacterium]